MHAPCEVRAHFANNNCSRLWLKG